MRFGGLFQECSLNSVLTLGGVYRIIYLGILLKGQGFVAGHFQIEWIGGRAAGRICLRGS